METLSQLPKTTTKGSRRIGRGYGSQKGGHTSSRGSKGDKVRGTTKITFDGTKIKKGWIKRTPFLRGKHRTQKLGTVATFNLAYLEKMFKADGVVSPKTLGVPAAKILSDGQLTKALKFEGVKVSSKAKQAILSVGGKID